MPAETRTARRRTAARERAAEAVVHARRRRRRIAGAVIAAVVLLAVVVTVLVQRGSTSTSDADAASTSAPEAAAAPDGAVEGGTAFVLGPDDAPVTVDVYEDYLCPGCANFEEANRDQLAALAEEGAAQVRYRPIAFLDRASDDRYSTRALNAAGVVADAAGIEAFRTFSEALFAELPAEGGPGLTDERLVELAAEAGASGDAVAEGITGLRFEEWTRAVTDAAGRAGVRGAPTVLVDGRPLDAPTVKRLGEAVRAAAE